MYRSSTSTTVGSPYVLGQSYDRTVNQLTSQQKVRHAFFSDENVKHVKLLVHQHLQQTQLLMHVSNDTIMNIMEHVYSMNCVDNRPLDSKYITMMNTAVMSILFPKQKRDSFLDTSTTALMHEQQRRKKTYDLFYDERAPQNIDTSMISKHLEPNELSRKFFTNANRDALQQRIINQIQTQYNKTLSRQSDTELNIIMKSMFLQYRADGTGVQVSEQLQELNNAVIEECIRIIMPNVLQYEGYIAGLNEQGNRKGLQIMANPLNVYQNRGDIAAPIAF
jgi:hypothetical protein